MAVVSTLELFGQMGSLELSVSDNYMYLYFQRYIHVEWKPHPLIRVAWHFVSVSVMTDQIRAAVVVVVVNKDVVLFLLMLINQGCLRF